MLGLISLFSGWHHHTLSVASSLILDTYSVSRRRRLVDKQPATFLDLRTNHRASWSWIHISFFLLLAHTSVSSLRTNLREYPRGRMFLCHPTLFLLTSTYGFLITLGVAFCWFGVFPTLCLSLSLWRVRLCASLQNTTSYYTQYPPFYIDWTEEGLDGAAVGFFCCWSSPTPTQPSGLLLLSQNGVYSFLESLLPKTHHTYFVVVIYIIFGILSFLLDRQEEEGRWNGGRPCCR